jgi:hypothetical protein
VAAPDFGISEPSNGLKNEGRDLEGYRFPREFCYRFPGDFCLRQLYCRKHHQPAGGCAKLFAQEHALVSTQRGKITKAACAEFKVHLFRVPLWIISAAFGVYLRVV